MIEATSISVREYKDGARKVKVSLVADEQAEVSAIGTSGATVSNLGPNDTMLFGSTCLCTNGDFGMLNSSGEWVF